MKPISSKEALALKIPLEKFQRVNVFASNHLDQMVGKNTSYFLGVLKRFIKNRWAVLFLIIIICLVLLAILVPIFSSYSATNNILNSVTSNSVSNIELSYNLRPRIPSLGINGTFQVVMLKSNFESIANTNPGFLVGNKSEYSGYIIATINPYVLDVFKDIYPFFGTDVSGIDVWTKTWTAVRSSLSLGVTVALISVIIGAIYGGIAGMFAGKWIDNLMIRILEILNSVPAIIWLIVLSFVLPLAINTSNNNQILDTSLLLPLILISWMGPAWMTRIFILQRKDANYIQATKTLGSSNFRILFVHLFPTIAGRLLVRFVNMVPSIIYFEATLIFLGLRSSFALGLGSIIFDSYQNLENIYPLLLPSIIMMALTLSSRIVANALNDAVDPRVENKY